MPWDKQAAQLLPAPEKGLVLEPRASTGVRPPCQRGHEYTSGSTVSAQPALSQTAVRTHRVLTRLLNPGTGNRELPPRPFLTPDPQKSESTRQRWLVYTLHPGVVFSIAIDEPSESGNWLIAELGAPCPCGTDAESL